MHSESTFVLFQHKKIIMNQATKNANFVIFFTFAISSNQILSVFEILNGN